MENQPPPGPPPLPPAPKKDDPYDFIKNPESVQKKTLLPSGNSLKSRIFIVGGGVVVLIILASFISGLLGRANEETRKDLTKAFQQQIELIRICDLGNKNAVGTEAKNLATSTILVLNTDKESLKAIAKKAKIEVDTKEVALGKNTETDELLSKAKQLNQFDQVFNDTVREQLEDYQATLKKLYESSSNETNKKTLEQMYRNAGLLIQNQSSTQTTN